MNYRYILWFVTDAADSPIGLQLPTSVSPQTNASATLHVSITPEWKQQAAGAACLQHIRHYLIEIISQKANLMIKSGSIFAASYGRGRGRCRAGNFLALRWRVHPVSVESKKTKKTTYKISLLLGTIWGRCTLQAGQGSFQIILAFVTLMLTVTQSGDTRARRHSSFAHHPNWHLPLMDDWAFLWA